MPLEWQTLPTEIRWMIFDNVIADHSDLDGLVRVQYATVCKEWQMAFEEETFRVLLIDSDRLEDFEQHVSNNERRRTYVRGLVLRVKLEEYDCSKCQFLEDEDTQKRNDKIFIPTLLQLLKLLSTWPSDRSGIWLDLGAYSPSDARHAFRDIHLTANYPYLPGDSTPADRPEAVVLYAKHAAALNDSGEDNCPGWASTCAGFPAAGATGHLLAEVGRHVYTELNFKSGGRKKVRRLPEVKVITGLQIRNQSFRRISPLILSKILKQSLTRLESFRHERWHDWYQPHEHNRKACKTYLSTLMSGLSDNLQEIHLSGYSTKQLRGFGITSHYDPGARQSARFARSATARGLKKLSVDSDVNAQGFFEAFWVWPSGLQRDAPDYPDLEHLSLCAKLNSHRDPEAPTTNLYPSAVDMLQAAAHAVLEHMPKLKVLEIWDPNRYGGCAFTYHVVDGQPTLSWSTACNHVHMDNVFRHWSDLVSSTRPGTQLHVEVEENIFLGTRIEILQHMVLGDEILHPLSRSQVEMAVSKGYRRIVVEQMEEQRETFHSLDM